MKIVVNPPRTEWTALLKRPYVDNRAVIESVRAIVGQVRTGGDAALRDLATRFEGGAPIALQVGPEAIGWSGESLSNELRDAIRLAARNIEAFHRSQLSDPVPIQTMPGVTCWRRSVGIERVGLYIPGGSAPLFSTVLMLGIPARLAGCREVILCTPGTDGSVHPAILFAAGLVGVSKVFATGGAQAIAAMAYGTETIPAVSKIFGPGNQYVTAAKQLVQMDGIAIDMPAGPSEVCVLADETANPSFVAADLLSQAEHGADSQVLLVSTSEAVVIAVVRELAAQVAALPRKETANRALANSTAVLVQSLSEAIDLVNEYAAEHLILSCASAERVGDRVVNAGSVFLGHYTPESVGDYASGTNHTLPTNGFARAYSGVSVDSFVRKITYQRLTREGLRGIGPSVVAMAEAEGLRGHAAAVSVRLAEKTTNSDHEL
ncbi:MAG: histidinol dehydrogenase [Flaviaesturariibacter sp.]|nr:histidinol dehydrogenase [Flaviaesturariibacter sp.]